MSAKTNALSIAVISDVICPWCYLGKRRLERALDGMALREATSVTWLPFELNPDMPAEGMDRQVYRTAKFGAERSAAFDRQLTALGEEEGIHFAFAQQTRTPNTRRAHALIAAANEAGYGDAVVTALFRGYFEEGRDIGDPRVLADLGAAGGMSRDAALAAADDPGRHREVQAREAEAARLGVSGVPFFIVNGAYAISGAQPVDVLRDALTRITAAPAA
jgi:predicted DsbA family dithiol-disulfide isomerase